MIISVNMVKLKTSMSRLIPQQVVHVASLSLSTNSLIPLIRSSLPVIISSITRKSIQRRQRHALERSLSVDSFLRLAMRKLRLILHSLET